MEAITITVRDKPEGGVEIISKPSFGDLMNSVINGNNDSAAAGFAIAMLRKVFDISRSKQKSNIIHVPRIGRL